MSGYLNNCYLPMERADYIKPKTATGKEAAVTHFNQERELFVFCD